MHLFPTADIDMLDKLGQSNISPNLLGKAKEVLNLVDRGKSVITVAGPAGTGKSVLIGEVMKGVHGNVCVVAFTGQAARMLQKRGIAATTIHRLILKVGAVDPRELTKLRYEIDCLSQSTDSVRRKRLEDRLQKLVEPRFTLKKNSPLANAALCIIDEASMVPMDLGEKLMSFGVPLLAVGDPYQLGPVRGQPYFNLARPDVRLTKIYRQEATSKILELATRVREQKTRGYSEQKDGEVFVRPFRLMKENEILSWMRHVDQIICYSNNSRRDANRRMLKYHGIDIAKHRYPVGSDAEKIICLSTNYALNLTNGMPIRLEKMYETRQIACTSMRRSWLKTVILTMVARFRRLEDAPISTKVISTSRQKSATTRMLKDGPPSTLQASPTSLSATGATALRSTKPKAANGKEYYSSPNRGLGIATSEVAATTLQ